MLDVLSQEIQMVAKAVLSRGVVYTKRGVDYTIPAGMQIKVDMGSYVALINLDHVQLSLADFQVTNAS